MKFSWRWLSEYVDLDGIRPEFVADRFTRSVAELEGMETIGHGLREVLAGRIVAVLPHPSSDKLRIVDVDVGDGRVVRGVSGAPNLSEGATVPAALPGVVLPGGIEVRTTDVRGVSSAVVLLSERELALSDDHSGVMILPPQTRPGTPLPEVLPVEDTVFEVDNKSITHRPDLWGHHGIAREIAAMLGRPLRPLDDSLPEGEGDSLDVAVEDGRDCPRYLAQAFYGVRIAPSPFWLRHRLRSVGVRPISNVVDLTNYVMLATGEPTHAFDRRQLPSGIIRVRRAKPGEPLRTLDGKDHVLTAEDLLIADAGRGVALAGVMGGENSEIADDTTSLVLEAATFHPGLIRRTAVRHGMRTEASARFEKSLDPNLPVLALSMFSRMLREICPGARPCSPVADVASFDRTPKRVRLDPAYVSRRLGIDVPPQRTRSILTALGFGIAETDRGFDVTIPSFRATRDISIPVDLVEEVGRVIGYDQVPPTPPVAPVVLVPRQIRRHLISRAKSCLARECGLDEVMTYSFDSQSLLARIGWRPDNAPRLRNALSADHVSLRTELAPSLLGVLDTNARRFEDFGVFEVSRVFSAIPDAEGIPSQGYRLGIALYDRQARTGGQATALFRRLKGILDALFLRIDLGKAEMDAAPASLPDRPWLHPARAVAIRLMGRELGIVTGVHPAVMRRLDLVGHAVLAELDVEILANLDPVHKKFTPVQRFPAIQADLSLVVPERSASKDFETVVRNWGGEHLVAVDLVAVYAGDPIPAGFCSLTFRMTFAAPDRTLSDAEVKAALDQILGAAVERGASVRT